MRKDRHPYPQATQGNPHYLRLLDDMRSLHVRKSAGYGSDDDQWANFRGSGAWGVEPFRGALVRAGDKWARLQNILRHPDREQVGESVVETAVDMAAYMLIFVCLWEEEAASRDGVIPSGP